MPEPTSPVRDEGIATSKPFLQSKAPLKPVTKQRIGWILETRGQEADLAQLEAAMKGHVLAHGELIGTYQKKGR